jgi:hypothetical protein
VRKLYFSKLTKLISIKFCENDERHDPSRYYKALILYIHTYHSRFIPKRVTKSNEILLRYTTFYQNDLAMMNTADTIGDKPSATCSQSISDVSAVGPLVAFYDITGRKTELLIYSSVPDITLSPITFFCSLS